MTIWALAASLGLAAEVAAPALPPLAADAAFDAVAADVASVTDLCFRLATGELRWDPRNVNEEIALVEAAGLTYGVPGGVLDSLGSVGQASVNRATMASRSRGGFHVILAVGGSIPGCRVMLAGNNRAGMTTAIAASLKAQGWADVEGVATTSATYERRLLVRNVRGKWYKLDFAWGGNPSTQLRMLIAPSLVD